MLKRILAALGYISATLFVIGLTVGLVAYGSGYSYNFKTGRIVRTGLIILQSVPSGLPISVNGKSIKKKTPYRFSKEAGHYRVGLSRDGYRSWQKTLTAIASEVTTAQYIYLLPLSPKTTTVETRPAYISPVISDDHRRLAYISGGSDPALYTLDLNDPTAQAVRMYQPLAATAIEPAETLTSVLWSHDGSRLLLESKVGTSVIHRLFTYGSNAAPINLTTQYGFELLGAQFSESNARQLYWISPDGLRRLDTGAQTVSGVLAANVSQFKIASRNRVDYVQRSPAGVNSLWSINDAGVKQQLVPALVESPSYSIDTATYDNGDQLAIVPMATGIGTVYSDVFSDAPTSKVVARGVQTTHFSQDGHLLLFLGSQSMRTYDLERSQVDKQTVTYDFTSQGQVTSFTWFDNFHLLLNRGSRIVWSEYDGANQVDLAPLAADLPGFSSSDLRSILNFQPGTDGTVRLVRTITRP